MEEGFMHLGSRSKGRIASWPCPTIHAKGLGSVGLRVWAQEPHAETHVPSSFPPADFFGSPVQVLLHYTESTPVSLPVCVRIRPYILLKCRFSYQSGMANAVAFFTSSQVMPLVHEPHFKQQDSTLDQNLCLLPEFSLNLHSYNQLKIFLNDC